ncbi:Na+/H+ antiporter subunit C [Chlorobaculum sp. MV4-Y]|jgi:multicomponent Na+:H+ antiporter subunit C|uniref:Na+/H+ antiporter subunit C n=1 Tax=Chlorobaculum sp. MV4-Y TaxID=2976335 RepID=UPI0021B012BC|nr:Na+/H+ antiporter subunit C [Chlorobaculum sp. MV4-Y]UWX57738.1 Na+/H+ antiporter subunit C [Chlorobaculum sp. MV4-Y]
MTLLLALITGLFYAAGIYLILRRSLVKVIFGIMFLGHAANMLIFSTGRLTKGSPAFVPEGAQALAEPFADPLPQALILTAIVIGFGLQAVAIVLFRRSFEELGTDDVDAMRTTDRIDGGES